MLPAFATIEDLAERIPGGIKEDDEPRAQAALISASTKIRAEAGKLWVDTEGDLVDGIPDIIVEICLSSAKRAFDNPDETTSESIGTYSQTRSSPEAYLNSWERRQIRRAAGSTGLWSLPTTRGPLETDRDDTSYLPVVGGSPIPFTGPDGY